MVIADPNQYTTHNEIRVFVGFHLSLENKPSIKSLSLGIVCDSLGLVSAGHKKNHWFSDSFCLIAGYSTLAGLFWTGGASAEKHEVSQATFNEIVRANSVLRYANIESVPGNEQVIDPVHMGVRPGHKLKRCQMASKSITESKTLPITQCKVGFKRGIHRLSPVPYRKRHSAKQSKTFLIQQFI